MWGYCPLFSLQPAGDQPSTCCLCRIGDGILLQAEDFIPGVYPLQEEAFADEPWKRDRTFSPVLHSTKTLNQLWHRSHCKPSGSKPWFCCRSPIHHFRAHGHHEIFLLVPVAALLLEAFPGEGNTERSPTYPRNSNCIFLHSPCRVFWEGCGPQDPVQRDKSVAAPTCSRLQLSSPPAPTPFQKHRSAVLSLSPC